jgi:hypothetical protein
MIVKDSMYHSSLPYFSAENIIYSNNSSIKNPETYKDFIKNYYNISYDVVLNDKIKYLATTAVYLWAKSPKHNEIMLSNRKEAAVHTFVKSVTKEDNLFRGKEIFKGYGDFIINTHSASTFQLK